MLLVTFPSASNKAVNHLHSTQNNTKSVELPDFYELLHKSRRFEECYQGNRHNWMIANMYFAAIKGAPNEVEAIAQHAIAHGKPAHIVDRKKADTWRVVNDRRAQAWRYACALIPSWHINAKRVAAQMALYGWHTGFCCAAQGTLAKTLGLSRQAVNRWIMRLRKAGVIEVVSYDARGSFEWQGRWYTSWCLVLDVGWHWGKAKGDTIPISAVCGSAVQQLAVGSSAHGKAIHSAGRPQIPASAVHR